VWLTNIYHSVQRREAPMLGDGAVSGIAPSHGFMVVGIRLLLETTKTAAQSASVIIISLVRHSVSFGTGRSSKSLT
jgi:hypothetical protein